MVSLDSDIFVMAEQPGLFASKITRFTVFFKLPFKNHDLYPSNRTPRHHHPFTAPLQSRLQKDTKSTEPLLTKTQWSGSALDHGDKIYLMASHYLFLSRIGKSDNHLLSLVKL